MTSPRLTPPPPDAKDKYPAAHARYLELEARQGWQKPLGIDQPAIKDVARRLRTLAWINGRLKGNRNPSPAPPVGDNWLVVCVGFPDKPFTTISTVYDDLFFGNGNSVATYFQAQSQGRYAPHSTALPSSIGIRMAPENYGFYARINGMAGYPGNSQGLFETVVKDLANSGFDFRPFDNDGDGIVEGVAIVHAGGEGAVSGSPDDFWAHQWSFGPINVGHGLTIREFMIVPEYLLKPGDIVGKPGLLAHESGHLHLGLPDLYAYGPKMVGRWGLMANGSWNGSLGSNPANMCAFSRIVSGFVDPAPLTSGLVEFLPHQPQVVYVDGLTDYFTLEFVGTDGYARNMPGHELIIMQVRDHGQSNLDPDNARVKVIEADGRQDLVAGVNYGEPRDAFPCLFPAHGETSGYWRRRFGPHDTEGTTSRWVDGRQVFSLDNIHVAPDGLKITANCKLGPGVVGDFNGDGMTDFADIGQLVEAIFFGGIATPDMDVNGDRAVDSVDLAAVANMIVNRSVA